MSLLKLKKINYAFSSIVLKMKRFKNIFSFLLTFNGLVIVCKLPASKNEETGYFYRICAIDRILKNVPVVYINWNCAICSNTYFCDNRKRFQINLKYKFGYLLSFLFILKAKNIYFHHVASILPVFKIFIRLPFINSFVDFHGAAPEEHEMAGYHNKVHIMTSLEKFSLSNISYGIVVTRAMQDYLLQKYSNIQIKIKFILLPIISDFASNIPINKVTGKCYVIYAGNTQKWQQIPLMVTAILKNIDNFNYILCCTDPETINNLFPNSTSLHAFSATHEELLKLYAKSHYGFALRDDSVVNRVACPTKIVEYLAFGIIPILNSASIGDFKLLGMNYIDIKDFINLNLPSEKERRIMAENNREVLKKLQLQHTDGTKKLLSSIIN